jgi:hypothetical protein
MYPNERSAAVDSDSPVRVSAVGRLIAFAMPVAVAVLVAILLAQTGPNKVRLIGIPDSHLESLAAAPKSDAEVSAERAIAVATDSTRDVSDGRVLDCALGRIREEPATTDSGRLVWVVSVAPDKTAKVFITGSIGYDHSCDWASHYDWVVAAIDAKSGEMFWRGSGASVDLSLPPTFVSPANSDHESCERWFEEQRRAVRSP